MNWYCTHRPRGASPCPDCLDRLAPSAFAEPVEGPAGDPEHGGSRVDDHRAPTVPAPPPTEPQEDP